jgi:hypothetical protein
MITTKSSHPDDKDMNVRMTTNFPFDGIVVKLPRPSIPADQSIGPGRQMVIFAGSDGRQLADQAALSYQASATRNAMSTAFGKIPFLKRFEQVVPQGCFLMGVPGSQVNDENRQVLFKNFCQHEPHLHIFQDLATSDYFVCAHRGFLLNFGIIATVVTADILTLFRKISTLPLLADAEKNLTGWSVADRLGLMRVYFEGEDVTAKFQGWFYDEKIEQTVKLNSVKGENFHEGNNSSAN